MNRPQQPSGDHVPGRILVVDDEETIRQGLSRVLVGEGYAVDTAADAESALRLALASPPDLVISDLHLPGKNGLELIAELQERGDEATFVVLTGHGSIDSAIEATRRGVYDYLVKPIDRPRLTTVVRKGLERAALRREVRHLRREMISAGRFQELVGCSPQMMEIYRLLEQIAPSSASVLITGESGTGKELVARTIHRLSPRAAARLVAINCAAIPENLLESEIFGHEKGAFTGATATRPGCFELAHQGSLLLDEIGEMPPDLQTKLLRVLEDGMVRRVGGASEVRVDVRVLAATNIPVEKLTRERGFREDLYYRLNVFAIRIPPLRERREDVSLLAEHFLSVFAGENTKQVAGFSDEAMERLLRHDWPGNARELRNAVQRAVILCSDGEILPRHLPDTVRGRVRAVPGAAEDGAVSIPVGTSIEEAEKALILETLAANGGNKTRTAEVLGVSAKTLYSKLRRYEGGEVGAAE
ncbi:MAG: sigma-54-dependent transcriptional regulator [Candidatus Eiseniibacteriota bacterium]